MIAVTVHAPAKLNLFLHIRGKRSDGYHFLESLVAFTDFGDDIQIFPSDKLSLTIEGEWAALLPADDSNLILKAAKKLRQMAGITAGARIILEKRIPVAGGIGGGSADAAAVLRGLCRLWNIAPDKESLLQLALELGSDIPVCIHSAPALMEGVGELLTPMRIPEGLFIVLVNPGKTLLTAQVFKHFSGGYTLTRSAFPGNASRTAFMQHLQSCHNALEAAATHIMPDIGRILLALRQTPGCRLARMSGSGGTCFGIYDSPEDAQQAADLMGGQHPEWWCTHTALRQEGIV